MKDELRDELKEKAVNVLNDYIKEIADGRYGIGAYDIVDVADSILSLIGAERCVWTEKTRSNGVIVYKTSCDKQAITWDQKDFNENPFCQACGKRIEVMEVEYGQ